MRPQEKVTECDLGLTWDPNAPNSVLLVTDAGNCVLALNPHPDDADRGCVSIVWTGSVTATMGPPNDEAITGHRLNGRGLEHVRWAGVVENSALIADLEQQNQVHPRHHALMFTGLTHHVLLLKEGVVEIVARAHHIRRFAGSTVRAAAASLEGEHTARGRLERSSWPF